MRPGNIDGEQYIMHFNIYDFQMYASNKTVIYVDKQLYYGQVMHCTVAMKWYLCIGDYIILILQGKTILSMVTLLVDLRMLMYIA